MATGGGSSGGTGAASGVLSPWAVYEEPPFPGNAVFVRVPAPGVPPVPGGVPRLWFTRYDTGEDARFIRTAPPFLAVVKVPGRVPPSFFSRYDSHEEARIFSSAPPPANLGNPGRMIQFDRGPEPHLPALAVGQPAWTTDTHKLYVGSDIGNVLVNSSGGGGGSVSSVALAAPSQFTVSGSPVTSSGTLSLSWANQNANSFLAGPTASPAAAPSFRVLVGSDLPVFGASGLSHAPGGVPDPGSTAGTTRFLREDATWDVPPGIGTVTSVGLSAPSIFTVSGSPVTASGTLALALANENANTVFAGPSSGVAAAPTFRGLVGADLPVFGASGASHSQGAVPDPGSTAGTIRFLREDATWDAITASDLSIPGIVQGRLSATSGNVIPNTGGPPLYFLPYKGNYISLYYGGAWKLYNFGTQLAFNVNITSPVLSPGVPTDIFAYWTGSQINLQQVNWTNANTRATALGTQDGVYVLSTDTTKLYLGTIALNASSGVEDSLVNRLVWNYYNRVQRKLLWNPAASSWTYNALAWRLANGGTDANGKPQVACVIGVSEQPTIVTVMAQASLLNSYLVAIAIGAASTTPQGDCRDAGYIAGSGVSSANTITMAMLKDYSLGYQAYSWLETTQSTAGTTVYGTTTDNAVVSGIVGETWG